MSLGADAGTWDIAQRIWCSSMHRVYPVSSSKELSRVFPWCVFLEDVQEGCAGADTCRLASGDEAWCTGCQGSGVPCFDILLLVQLEQRLYRYHPPSTSNSLVLPSRCVLTIASLIAPRPYGAIRRDCHEPRVVPDVWSASPRATSESQRRATRLQSRLQCQHVQGCVLNSS